MSILSMISVLLMVSVPAIYRGLQSASERAVATSLAENRIALADRQDLATAEATTTATVDGVEYTINMELRPVNDEEAQPMAEERIRAVEVTVTWDSVRGEKSHRTTAYLARRGN